MNEVVLTFISALVGFLHKIMDSYVCDGFISPSESHTLKWYGIVMDKMNGTCSEV